MCCYARVKRKLRKRKNAKRKLGKRKNAKRKLGKRKNAKRKFLQTKTLLCFVVVTVLVVFLF